jgi:hypothetical protein
MVWMWLRIVAGENFELEITGQTGTGIDEQR